LFIIATWDGHGIDVGPDIWDLTVVGGTPCCTPHSATSRIVRRVIAIRIFQECIQAVTFHGGQGPSRQTRSVSITCTGLWDDQDGGDAVYHLTYSFHTPMPQSRFDFSASLPGTPNQFWGLDNVVVSTSGSAADVCTVDQICPCADQPLAGHGQPYPIHALRVGGRNGLVQAGLLTQTQSKEAQVAAKGSNCGR